MNNDIVICAVAKNEEKYLYEWVSYHLNLGFDRIYLYDDNDPENGDILISDIESLKPFIDNEQLIINRCSHLERPQMKVYTECYRTYEFAWMLFIDIDEFVELPRFENIKDFLYQEKFNDADVIALSWLMMGDNEHMTYENKPVRERFTNRAYNYKEKTDMLIKCICRSNISGGKVVNPHYIISEIPEVNNNLKMYNAIGELVKIDPRVATIPVQYTDAYISHYFTKSMEEFVTIKIKRGSAARPDNIRRSLNFYWDTNEKTDRRISYMKYFVEKVQERYGLHLKGLDDLCDNTFYEING